MFAHLNCHSNYSFLAGANSIRDLVDAVNHIQSPALALTDTNGLYGAVEFDRIAKNAGIHPILGVELTSQTPPNTPVKPNNLKFIKGTEHFTINHDQPITQRATILAKNITGFGEICRAITARHLDSQFSLVKQLITLSDNVILICPNLDLLNQIAQKRGGQNIYAELAHFPDRKILQFARDKNLPVVATNRVFFCQPEDREVHLLLSAIRTKKTIYSIPQKESISKDGWMKPPKNMIRIFKNIPDAISNTLKIAGQCDVTLPIGKINFPPFTPPEGETHSSYLGKLARIGIAQIYHNPIPVKVVRRLRYELKIIHDLKFSPYFLIVSDIVREARARGIQTVGRGSAANSLVCHALKITEVNPIHHNLYFERFLNPERTDYPDIDVDFSSDKRDEILNYVFKKYGRGYVALISAHIHFRGRSSLREVGKAIGVPTKEIDRLTGPLPQSILISQINEVRKIVPECRDLPLEDEPYRSMISLAQRIEGFPRHISVHSGGIVISPFVLTDLIPLQRTSKGFVVTQYDMHPVEDMGLLKIDLLAQKGLAVLADTLSTIKEMNGECVDFNLTDPTVDKKTCQLISHGNTIGCFYIESPAMRHLLIKLDVRSFSTLTAASSIIRPGIAESGMMKKFIQRHNGKESAAYLDPRMKTILNDTFGVMIYQEDVMKVANTIAGMSLGEADGLRKCMGKNRNRNKINRYRQRFLSGASSNGVKTHTALEIWRQIESFAGYAFCKAHSASFAMVSYRTAYLKAHYPTEFMAAVLSNRGGFYDTSTYIEEARRMGIQFLLPHINYSFHGFTANNSFIRIALSQVKGLKKNSINSILKIRREKPYTSIIDFLSRVDIDKLEIEALIRCGAMDDLEHSRPEMLWILKVFLKNGKGRPMFPVPPLKLKEYSFRDKLLAELEHLNLAVSGHLLTLFKSPGKTTQAIKLPHFIGCLVTLTGWVVTTKQTLTQSNRPMKFMTLEDSTALFDAILLPIVYKQFGTLLYDRGPYIIQGRVKKEGRLISVIVSWINRLHSSEADIT